MLREAELEVISKETDVGRVVILEFEADKPHKLPDHHNVFGEAWWNDGDVKDWRCAFSAIGDA